jgi:hypothetical protein
MAESGISKPDESAASTRDLAQSGMRISLWRRTDLIVTDPDRVLAAGRARHREN